MGGILVFLGSFLDVLLLVPIVFLTGVFRYWHIEGIWQSAWERFSFPTWQMRLKRAKLQQDIDLTSQSVASICVIIDAYFGMLAITFNGEVFQNVVFLVSAIRIAFTYFAIKWLLVILYLGADLRWRQRVKHIRNTKN